jgi:hypothetical protein
MGMFLFITLDPGALRALRALRALLVYYSSPRHADNSQILSRDSCDGARRL